MSLSCMPWLFNAAAHRRADLWLASIIAPGAMSTDGAGEQRVELSDRAFEA
jgi:hypothetical protein